MAENNKAFRLIEEEARKRGRRGESIFPIEGSLEDMIYRVRLLTGIRTVKFINSSLLSTLAATGKGSPRSSVPFWVGLVDSWVWSERVEIYDLPVTRMVAETTIRENCRNGIVVFVIVGGELRIS